MQRPPRLTFPMPWLKRSRFVWRPFLFPFGVVAFVALIHILASVGLGGSPEAWGNIPRTLDGMNGILTSHLRHASWGHWIVGRPVIHIGASGLV